MNDAFLASMHEAMELLHTAGPLQATAVIQRALNQSDPAPASKSAPMPAQVVQHLLEHHFVAPDTTSEQRYKTTTTVGDFSVGQFSNQAGKRAYKLYKPRSEMHARMPLVVMLHGCTQDADDFAAGTRMNALADKFGFMVMYPIQPPTANPSKCWNWFRRGDQQAGSGEPSILAGMTQEVIANHHIDPDRVYIAGLSAGGAMAAVMIQSYPELFAAAGVHSGLPAGSAHDLPSALAAMKGGKVLSAAKRNAATPRRPLIIFHGDADCTVHRSNGDRLIEPYERGGAQKRVEYGSSGAGRHYTRGLVKTPGGIDAEFWLLHDTGHAWSGGGGGTYTDPKGPDASAEMVRFFLSHPQSSLL
nr:PHB depolymerase family esterase [Cupriavidus sp. SW-Y-13]